jgi:hypothetical protein
LTEGRGGEGTIEQWLGAVRAYEGSPEWQGKSLSTTGNEEWTMA